MTSTSAQREPGRSVLLGLGRAAAWLLLAGLVLVPLGMVVSLALGGNHLRELLAEGIVPAAWNSVWTSLLTAVFSVAFGALLALLLERTDLPGRRWLRLLALSPMLMPPFIGAIAWAGLFGPGGTFNTMFAHPIWNIYSGAGVVFLLTLHATPLAYVIIAGALRRVPSQLEEAGRIAGAAPARVLGDVVVPMLRPAMMSAFTLTAVSSLGDFGIPALIGVPVRFNTLATLVYRFIQSGTVEQPLQVVSQVGVVLLVLGLAGVVADFLWAPSGNDLEGGQVTPLRLGATRWLAAPIAWVLVVFLTVVPILALAERSVLPAPGVELSLHTITAKNFTNALTSPNVQTGILNSVLLAVGAAVACTLIGTLIAVLTTQTRSRDNAALTVLTLLPQAVPGTITAVGWLIAGRYSVVLYNTRWLILLAYITAFTAIVVQSVRAPLSGTPATLLEAARMSGATKTRSILDIAVRLARPAALTGGLLVALTAVRELTLSALLLAPGTQTLGVQIFNLQQAGDYNSASALSLLVALLGLVGLAAGAGGQVGAGQGRG